MNVIEELPNILDAFSGLLSKARRVFAGVSLAESPRKHYLLLLTYSSLFSNFSACLALMRAREFASVPLVLRPILEACADISNLIKYKEYADRLACSIAKQYVRYLRGLSVLKTVPDFVEADLQNYLNRVARCNQDNVCSLSKRDKFVLAGMEDEYAAIYSMMSGSLHNDYNFTLRKNPILQQDVLTLHATQCRFFDMILAYVLFMFEAVTLSTRQVASVIGNYDVEAFSSFQSDSVEVKSTLDLIALVYCEMPTESCE